MRTISKNLICSMKISLICLLAIALFVVVEGQTQRRWLKRGLSEASQFFAHSPDLQCGDYSLVQKAFLSKYGADAAASVYSWAPPQLRAQI